MADPLPVRPKERQMIWAIFLKGIYSALILGVTIILLRELYLIWWDDRVYVGKFDIITNSGGEKAESTEFARNVVAAQAVMAQQLQTYQQVSDPNAPTDGTYALFPEQGLSLPADALKGVDITVQNVNLTAIFTALRKNFTAPNEVRGSVTSSPGSVLAAVNWSRAPVPKGDSPEPMQQFFVPSQPTLTSAANYIACSLSWARGAAQSEELAQVSRAQFCDFASALNVLYSVNEKAHGADGLSAQEIALIRRRSDVLASHRQIADRLPDIYRLRADLLDVLPDHVRSQADLVAAQEDRLNYALLSPSLASLPEEDRRFAALALARPAIRMDSGEPVLAPSNWQSILKRYSENVRRSALSTGVLLGRNNFGSDFAVEGRDPVGTAFIVAPNLAITASHVLQAARRQVPEGEVGDIVICFEDTIKDCSETFQVTKVHYESNVRDEDIALLEVARHSPVHHPPLPLAESGPLKGSLVGSYGYVVGYPFADFRMPMQFVSTLLGAPLVNPEHGVAASTQEAVAALGGVRRLMPGRLLAFEAGMERFTSDISTTGGTSGGALSDLATGAVLGVSLAGEWRGERGKFSFSSPIPEEVRHMINRRLAELPIVEKSEEEGPVEANAGSQNAPDAEPLEEEGKLVPEVE